MLRPSSFVSRLRGQQPDLPSIYLMRFTETLAKMVSPARNAYIFFQLLQNASLCCILIWTNKPSYHHGTSDLACVKSTHTNGGLSYNRKGRAGRHQGLLSTKVNTRASIASPSLPTPRTIIDTHTQTEIDISSGSH